MKQIPTPEEAFSENYAQQEVDEAYFGLNYDLEDILAETHNDSELMSIDTAGIGRSELLAAKKMEEELKSKGWYTVLTKHSPSEFSLDMYDIRGYILYFSKNKDVLPTKPKTKFQKFLSKLLREDEIIEGT